VGSSNLSFGTNGKIASIKVGFGTKVTAGQVLAELTDVESIEKELMMQESAVATAQSTYESSPTATNKQALDAAQNKLNEIKGKLSKARIVAPFSGTISEFSGVKEGASVKAGAKIFSISSNKSFVVHAPTADFASFDVGMSVNCDYNGAAFKGTVVYTPDETPGSEKEYGLLDGFRGVVVALNKVPETAKLGDTISVKKVIASKDNVLVIPKNTVMEYDGKFIVFVWQNGIRVEREITVGLQAAYDYEVISGLDAGDQITY
jgi:macrolide-specific efflux system membrane fusion protein